MVLRAVSALSLLALGAGCAGTGPAAHPVEDPVVEARPPDLAPLLAAHNRRVDLLLKAKAR